MCKRECLCERDVCVRELCVLKMCVCRKRDVCVEVRD